MKQIQVRVLNGTVIDAIIPEGYCLLVYDQDLVGEPEMSKLTRTIHPKWGEAIVSSYQPNLQEPWR